MTRSTKAVLESTIVRRAFFLLILVSIFTTLIPRQAVAATLPESVQIVTDSIQLIARRRVGRTHLDYIYTIDVQNLNANDTTGVTALVSSTQSSAEIIQDSLTFGDIASGETVTSQSEFTVRVPRREPVNESALSFEISGNLINTPPIADAGSDQNAITGNSITLNGSNSVDADGDSLSYQWQLLSKPLASNTQLSDTSVVMPTFTADVGGNYQFQLIVNDGFIDSTIATVLVRAGEPPELQKVVIIGESKLLTFLGERYIFSAQGYDQFGNEIDTVIEWQGTHQDQVYVDNQTGEVEALSIGSTTITAHAGDISSAPVTAIFAILKPDLVAIADNQILTPPEVIPVTTEDPILYTVGLQYQLTLHQLINTPALGQILYNQGGIPFLGRVEEITQTNAGEYLLILSVVALNDLFEQLVIDEDIPLKDVPINYDELTLEHYSITENADGSITLEPKITNPAETVSTRLARAAVGTSANPFAPFECEFTSPVGGNPFSLGAGDSTIELIQDLSVPLIFNTDDELEKIAVRGTVKATFSSKIKVALAIEAKISCEYTVGRIFIPLPGLVGLVLGAHVPLGVGLDLGGKLTLADTGYELKSEASLTAEYGYYYPPECAGTTSSGCGFLGSAESDSKLELTLDLLDPDNITDDIRLEPAASAYGFAKIGIGSRFLPVTQSVELVVIQAGATLGANLATVNAQINDSSVINYKSDYKLNLDGLAKPGKTVEEALRFFGIVNFAKLEIKFSQLIASSPASTSAGLIVDKATFNTGDELNFDVTLDETTINFLPLLYNVETINIYEKAVAGSGNTARLIATKNATSGQRQFDFSWTATHEGSTTDNYFAFVETTLLPLPVFADLELGPFIPIDNGMSGVVLGEDYQDSTDSDVQIWWSYISVRAPDADIYADDCRNATRLSGFEHPFPKTHTGSCLPLGFLNFEVESPENNVIAINSLLELSSMITCCLDGSIPVRRGATGEAIVHVRLDFSGPGELKIELSPDWITELTAGSHPGESPKSGYVQSIVTITENPAYYGSVRLPEKSTVPDFSSIRVELLKSIFPPDCCPNVEILTAMAPVSGAGSLLLKAYFVGGAVLGTASASGRMMTLTFTPSQ